MISTFGEVFEVDPKIKIAKNSDVPFIEMADIEPWARTVGSKRTKKFAGGSKFLDGDVLVARITPSLENGKPQSTEPRSQQNPLQQVDLQSSSLFVVSQVGACLNLPTTFCAQQTYARI